MNNEVEVSDEISPESSDEVTQNKISSGIVTAIQKRKNQISYLVIAISLALIITGIQAHLFYSRYTPQIEQTNEALFSLMLEKTRGEQLRGLQDQFQALITSLKGLAEISSRFEATYEVMGEHFREGPVGTMEQVQSEFQSIQELIKEKQQEEDAPVEALQEASDSIATLSEDMSRLQEVYAIPYDDLHSDIQNPPLYLWPTANYLREDSGYLNSVTFNRAIYLSQIGEMGTARVLLSGMYSNSNDNKMLGLVYYSLGRLQWELFLTRLEPENYFQAVSYLRQSLQTDSDAELSKRLFDYMLSLTEAESTPGAGKGDPTTLTEGEAGAVSTPDPLF